MDKGKQSYFAPEKEQMFEPRNNKSNNNNNSRANDRDNEFDKLFISLYKELEQGVKAEAYGEIKQKVDMLLLAFAQEMEKECEEEIERQKQELNILLSMLPQGMKKENEEENGRYKKNRKIVINMVLIEFIIVVFLFEYVIAEPYFMMTAILGVGSSLSIYIAKIYLEKEENIAYRRKSGEPITTGIVNVGIAIGQAIKEASLLHLVLLIWCTIILGGYFGSVGVVEVTYEFAAAGFTALKSTYDDVVIAVRVDEEVEEIIPTGGEEKKINMLPQEQVDITQAELNTIMELPQEYYDVEFYLNRRDIDWTDQNEINMAVWQMINRIRSRQMEDEFDKDVNEGGAPQQLRDLLYRASKEEIFAESFNEIESIRDIREYVYDQYPKKSLANLLSNDYQKLASILCLNDGNEDSIAYYYSQSIFWDFECLQFAQNSNDMVKDKLIRIAHKYKDMVHTCPNMKNMENVQALAEAFEIAANQY